VSFDAHYRFPGPWNTARVRAAIEETARELGALRLDVEERDGARELEVVTRWSPELVRRWGNGRDDGSADHGQFTVRWADDDPEPWVVSAFDSADDDGPLDVLGLGVDEPRLSTHGFGAVYCVGGSTIARAHPRGLLVEAAEVPAELRAVTIRGDDAWSVGSGGTVVQRVGGRWSTVAAPAREELVAVAFVGDELWIGGEQGAWSLRGETWSALPVERALAISCAPDGTPWIEGGPMVGSQWQGPPRYVAWHAWVGGDMPWTIGADTAWQPDGGRWIEHELHPYDVSTACAIAGEPWLGTHAGELARWNGRAFEPLDVGKVRHINAIAPYAGGAVIAVSRGWNDEPALLEIRPGAYGAVHVTSGRGGTGDTWGVTCELAGRMVRRLGGVVESL
jgi:hypothetical protein